MTENITTTKPTHAIVIGGSMAGLLTARVLSDHFDHVTIIERDQLPQSANFRGGVPQARHLHTLLVKGQRIMEEMFPGFNEAMLDEGAVPMTWGKDTHFVSTGGYTKHFESDIKSNSFARASLEWLVRRRVNTISTIEFLPETRVERLLTNEDRSVVTGIATLSRADKSTRDLYADLVVDASGRSSKAPEWLTEIGYSAPKETVINARAGYATRWYERPANAPFKGTTYVVQPRAPLGLYRGGGLMEVEDNRWVVTLIGSNADYPSTDDDAFLEFAASLATPNIYKWIKDAKPVSPIYGYRRLENRMRHYEKLTRRHENFIVTGDAACALNPVYGQGMTTSALEAVELGRLIASRDVRNLKGFAAQFQKALYKLTQGPWLMATSEDMRYPDVEGAKPDFASRMIHKYFDLVALAMPYDGVIGRRFVEAMHLLKPPTSLLAPGIALRVFRHAFLPHRQAATNEIRATMEVSAVGRLHEKG